jgi:hypothetical protein
MSSRERGILSNTRNTLYCEEAQDNHNARTEEIVVTRQTSSTRVNCQLIVDSFLNWEGGRNGEYLEETI